MNIELVIYFYSIIMTMSITFLWLRYAHKSEKLDLPNHRSSHQISVPRGGGIAIAITFISVIVFRFTVATNVVTAILISMPFLIISLTGYYDDLYDMPWKRKLILQIIAIFPLFAILPNYINIGIGFDNVFAISRIIYMPILLIAMLWVINLTNFMDGINGLLISEVLFLCLSSLLFRDYLALNSLQIDMIVVLFVSCFVFLPFNFPIARLFLGDVGSLFLGMCIAWLCIVYSFQSSRGIYAIIILFSLFWIDASVTLIHRLLIGKQIFEAHRTHIYQTIANDFLNSHVKTTLLFCCINVFWLLPLAYIAISTSYSLWIMLLAISPIMAICIFFRRKLYGKSK